MQVGVFHGQGCTEELAKKFIIVPITSQEPNVINSPIMAAVAIDLARVCKLGLPPEIRKKNAATTKSRIASGKATSHHKKLTMFLPVTNKSQKLHGMGVPEASLKLPHSTIAALAGMAEKKFSKNAKTDQNQSVWGAL